jgi:enamine deaminase RidA (YjgF/YER057c/UK114 family)
VTPQLINPEGLPTPATYTQVVVAAGSKMVFIAGQPFSTDDAGPTPPDAQLDAARTLLPKRTRIKKWLNCGSSSSTVWS